MDKVVQALVKKVAGAPSLKRRVPATTKGLQKAIPTTDNVLSAMSTTVVSLNDVDDERSRSRSQAIQEMIRAAGGMLAGADKTDAVVCDVRGINNAANLTLLQSSLQESISKLNRNGRIVLIANDAPKPGSSGLTREQVVSSAVSAGARGFIKSMAKEMAGRGITANTIMAATDLDVSQGLPGPMNFFLSKRSAFVTGQTLRLSNNGLFRINEQVSDAFSVRGKRVVITGASRGIGACTAKLFSAEGAQLLLLDHPAMGDTLKDFAAQLNCPYIAVDVTDTNSTNILKESIIRAYGDASVDVVVHNAGITRDKSYKKMSAAHFQSVLDVNLSSIIRMDDMLFSDCLKAGSRAVYLSSISGIAGTFGQTNYSCSKAGVMGYVEGLGASVGQHGIGVNAVAPGFIETEMTDKIPLLTRNAGRHMNAMLQGGFPVDVAETVLFLATPAAVGLNGNTLRVCGNHLIGA